MQTTPAAERLARPLSAFPRLHAATLLAAAIYAVALLVFYWRIVFLPDYAVPYDSMDAHFTAQSFFSHWIRKGVYPLWNPHVTMGYPIAGDMLMSPFYPFTVLSYLIPTGGPFQYKTLELVMLAHILLAGVSMYLLCRHFGLEFYAALFGGMSFMFAGIFPMRMSHEVWIKGTAWVPLLLLLFLRALDERGRRNLIACAVVFGLMILAGQWQICLYMAYVLGACVLVWGRGRRPRGAVRLAVTGLLAVGLAAVQILPSAELLPHAARQRLTFPDSALGAIDILALPTLLLPDLYRPSPEKDISPHFADPTLIHLYCGLIVLALAYVGFRSPPAGRRRERNFFAAVAAVAFLLAFGGHLPLYRLAFDWLPGFALFRRPYSFFFLVVLGLSVLAAFGVQALLAASVRENRYVRHVRSAAIAGLLLSLAAWGIFEWVLRAEAGLRTAFAHGSDVLFPLAQLLAHAFAVMLPVWFAVWAIASLALRSAIPRAALATLIIVAAFADLCYFNANRIFNTSRVNVSELVTDRAILGRPIPGDARLGHNGAGWYRVALGNFGGIFENAGDIMGFENLGGYNPLRLRTYTDFVGFIDGPNSRYLDLANVKYVLTSPSLQVPAPLPAEPLAGSPMNYHVFLRSGILNPDRYTFVGSTENNRYQLFENRSTLPRHFGVSQVVVRAEPREQIALLGSDFNFHGGVILDRSVTPPAANCSSLTWQLRDRTPNRTKLEVVSPGRCVMVSSELWYPGWRAYINGREVPVLRANYAFRAIEVPGGRHSVEMRFRPASVLAGAAISAASWLLAGLLLIAGRRARP